MMSAAPSTTERGPKTTEANALPAWDELIDALQTHAPQFLDLARKAQADGQTRERFVERMVAAANYARASDGLNAAFAMSKDEDLNLSQEEIEFALSELKAGSDPAVVIEQITRDRTAAAPWEAALAAYRAAQAHSIAVGGGPDAMDLMDDAQEALLLTPAPNAAAVLVKLSFLGQFPTSASDVVIDEALARSMIERGNSWSDRCVGAIYLDLQRLACGPEDAVEQWNAARSELQRRAKIFDEASDRSNEAYSRACEATEFPPEISKYLSIGYLEHAPISFAEKVRLAPLVKAHEDARNLAYEVARCEELDDIRDKAYDELSDAKCDLMDAQPPTLAALSEQIGLALLRATDEDINNDFVFDTSDGIAEVLASDDQTVLDLARLYVHSVRLAGLPRPPGWGEEFDVEAWVSEFESHPGHTLTPRGPEYLEPMAFGPDYPAYEDIKITDPEAIARYDEHVRSMFTPAAWKQYLKDRPGWQQGRPIPVQQEDALSWAYPDGGEEHDRLMALWRKRQEMRTAEPTGRHLWSNLAAWQKRLVHQLVEGDKARFPEGRTWDVLDWIEAYEGTGGTLHLDEDGEVVMGAPVPTPAHLLRLQRVMRYRANDVARHLIPRQQTDGGAE
jgi:hypothetical protein